MPGLHRMGPESLTAAPTCRKGSFCSAAAPPWPAHGRRPSGATPRPWQSPGAPLAVEVKGPQPVGRTIPTGIDRGGQRLLIVFSGLPDIFCRTFPQLIGQACPEKCPGFAQFCRPPVESEGLGMVFPVDAEGLSVLRLVQHEVKGILKAAKGHGLGQPAVHHPAAQGQQDPYGAPRPAQSGASVRPPSGRPPGIRVPARCIPGRTGTGPADSRRPRPRPAPPAGAVASPPVPARLPCRSRCTSGLSPPCR